LSLGEKVRHDGYRHNFEGFRIFAVIERKPNRRRRERGAHNAFCYSHNRVFHTVFMELLETLSRSTA